MWVSGLSFIDIKKLFMARNFFGFLAKDIPGANWLNITHLLFI